MSVLDTTFLVDLARGWPPAARMLNDLESFGGELIVPAACWMEYVYGLPAEKRAAGARTLERSVGFAPFDRGAAREGVRLQAMLKEKGRTLAWHDLQVAATALHLREELVSNDRRFDAVPGLVVQKY